MLFDLVKIGIMFLQMGLPSNIFPNGRILRDPSVITRRNIAIKPTADGRGIRVHRGVDAKVFRALQNDKKRAELGRWFSGKK